MIKSKNATILVVLLMLLYGILGTIKFIRENTFLYNYVINPVVWIGFVFALKLLIPKSYEKRKLKKEIINYILIASFSYIIVYIISGVFVTFGKNPYSTTLKGYIINLWIFMTVIVAKEIIRYLLINNVYERDKVLIACIISAVYVILDVLITITFVSQFTTLIIIKVISQVLLPSIAKNVLFSYIVMYSDYHPAILYEFIINTYTWLAPILPNSPWIITVVIDSMIPIIVYIYIRYTKIKNDLFKSREKLSRAEPRNIISLVVVVVFATWFALGIFPIAPIAIATGSMETELYVGDVAIIKKCNVNDIAVR